MKHVVIGTAGHVDHGKTALVRALTGVDTDRLAEEKRRGLTIELGFARLDFPDGSCAGVVDVPGHEKFIKTMLAGAGGIDLAMLVVAADEGFMPQTVEHLNILSLLGVRRGVVVLTKCDLADADWLAMARADLAARVKGTFLENAPVVETSAATGQGIEDLRETLHALVRQTREKSARVPFRLPIDRVFSVDGFGTVVTGTLIEGALHVGGEAELLPSGTRSRVRNLQVHGENTAIAVAGQRVAVNLAGIKKTDVIRGDTLAEPDSVRVSRLLDVRLSCLRDSERTVENGSRVHFCHGTAARLAKVVLLDRDALAPGESAYAQLRFTEDVAAKCGARFVIRFYSPLETIGGGIILKGKVLMGANAAAGEVSGLVSDISKMADDDFKLTSVERYSEAPLWAGMASASGLIFEYARQKHLPTGSPMPTGEEIFAAYNAGEPEAQKALKIFARRVAVGILSLQHVLDVEKVAIGGGISAAEALLPAIQAELDWLFERCTVMPAVKPELVHCRYGNDANLIGALKLFFEQNPA